MKMPRRPGRAELEAGVSAVRADLAREVRDPKGATLQVGWSSSPGRPMTPEWSPENAFRAYVSQWLVRRCVEIVAERISSWPFRVGEDPDKPGDYDKNAPMAQLLGPPPGTPNPELDAGALWVWGITNYIVTGRFGWEIERGTKKNLQPGRTDSSGIVGLWPLVTAELFPIPSDGGRTYFDGFELRPGSGARPVPYTREEVCYLWKPSPTNPREPESTLAAASLNVNILYEIDGYSYGFMRNDATPATMIVHGRFEKPAQRDAWRNQVLGNHRGSENAGKAMFVEGDVDENGKIQGAIEVLKLGASARDSELTTIYEQQLTAVCGALGVPLSRLDASGRTFDNAGQEDINWHEDKLLPLARALGAGVNRDLAPKFDDGKVGWFDLSKVRALRPALAPNVLFANVQADLTLDERRNFAGVDPADAAIRKELDDEKAAAVQAAQDAFAAQAAAKVPPEPGAKDGGTNAPNSDTAANANADNGAKGSSAIPRQAVGARDEAALAEYRADLAELDELRAGLAKLEPRDWHGRWITAGSVTHDKENLPVGSRVSYKTPGFDHLPEHGGSTGTIVEHTKSGYRIKEDGSGDAEPIGPKRITAVHSTGDGPGRLDALNGTHPAPTSAPRDMRPTDATGISPEVANHTLENTTGRLAVTLPDGTVVAANSQVSYSHAAVIGPLSPDNAPRHAEMHGQYYVAGFSKSATGAESKARQTARAFASHPDGSPAKSTPPVHVLPLRTVPGVRSELEERRGATVRRMTSLLGQQLAELDERAVSSTRARATGKRGQQLLRDGEVRADALYEPDFWTAATRTAVQPVFFAVASAAELALGLPPGEADLDAWASSRASAFAEARVAAQIGELALELSAIHETTNVIEAIGQRADALRSSSVSSQVVADAWDDAVRSLSPGIAVDDLRTLAVKLAAGELDLNAALAELGTT